MNELWKKRLPFLCAAAGGALLAGAVWACLSLERGGRADHITLAAALLILAELALLLLRREGCRLDTLLVMLLPIGAAMLVRALCLDYASLDYQDFLHHWYVYFQENGGFAAIAGSVGDYNVPYLYFMAAIS